MLHVHYAWDTYDPTAAFERRAPICAAKPYSTSDGEGITLWIALPKSEVDLDA